MMGCLKCAVLIIFLFFTNMKDQRGCNHVTCPVRWDVLSFREWSVNAEELLQGAALRTPPTLTGVIYIRLGKEMERLLKPR